MDAHTQVVPDIVDSVKRRKRGRGGAVDPTGREQRDANKGSWTETLRIQATSHSCTHAAATLQGGKADFSQHVDILASMKYASLPSTPSNHTQPDSRAMDTDDLPTQMAHMKEMQEMLAKIEAENGKLKTENGELKAELNARPTIEVPKQKPPPPPARQKTIKHRAQGGPTKPPPHPFGAEQERLYKQVEEMGKKLEAKDQAVIAKENELKQTSDRILLELRHYKEKCTNSQQSRRNLQHQVDGLKEQVATLQARGTSEQTKRELAEESLQRYKKQLEQAQEKIVEADNKMVIHSRFDFCGNKGNLQNQPREVTSAQVEGALEKLGHTINSLSTARQHYRAANTENTLHKEEIRKLKEQVCSLDGQLKSMRVHNWALQTRLTDAKHSLELAESARDNTNLARELQDCRQKLGQRATTISDLNVQIGDLVISKQQLENTNQELDQRIKAFEQVVSTVHTISADLAEKSKPFISR